MLPSLGIASPRIAARRIANLRGARHGAAIFTLLGAGHGDCNIPATALALEINLA